MCTVVFIPGSESFYLGSLRDESPERQRAFAPEIYTSGNISFLAPKDPVAGGTWIAVNEAGIMIVLLNGGFKNHERKKHYRKSRGLIVTELLASGAPVAEWGHTDLQDIEPFTLIVWSDHKLNELVWDGCKKHRVRLEATQPYIWSSSTLYNAAAKTVRKTLFQNWVATNPNISKLSLLNFFKLFDNAENGFLMNRKNVTKTLSYTFIEYYPGQKTVMNYYDFTDSFYCIKTILQKTNVLHASCQNERH